MGGSAAVFGKVGIGTSSTVDTALEVLSCSLRKQGQILEHEGIRGTRSRQSERAAPGTYSISGQIVCQPCPEELASILTWSGFSVASTTYSLTETLTSRYVDVYTGADKGLYGGVYVNRITLSSSENSPLTCTLDLVGQTETRSTSSFPAVTYTNSRPFMHHEVTGTFVSSSRAVKSVNVTIDNALIVAFNASQSANAIFPGNRNVAVSYTTPWTSAETDMYGQSVAGSAATIAYAYGGYSLSMAFAALQVPDSGPVISRIGSEIVGEFSGMARKSGSTAELIITLDSTP